MLGRETLWKGRSILIVEDDPLIRLELTDLFESLGAQIIVAHTCEQAVAAIEQRQICAALLDYGLQADNVAQLCGFLTECQIPYIFYTGCADLEQRYPCAVVVQKPASGEVLLASIAKLLVTDPAIGPDVLQQASARVHAWSPQSRQHSPLAATKIASWSERGNVTDA